MKRLLSFAAALTAFVVACSMLVRAFVPAVPANTWVPTSNQMAQVRAGATATLLPDGRVLIAGGVDDNGAVTASTERFSPDGALFLNATAMTTPRLNHTATLLADGRVLVTGGTGADAQPTASAEIYDPSANVWLATGAMGTARRGHTATLLADGRVLIIGGDAGGTATASIEYFDPVAQLFVSAGTLGVARTQHAAALLPSGRVLVAGGTDATVALGSTEIVDPVAGTVAAGPALTAARWGLTATGLLDGRVLLAGGADSTGALTAAETFDPTTGQVYATGNPLSAARQNHIAVLLPHNNQVLIVGGSAGNQPVGGAEYFIPWQGVYGTFCAAPVCSSGYAGPGTPALARAWAVGSALSFPASKTNRSGPGDGLLLLAGGTGQRSGELFGFATVKTDKEDYAPGTTVTITGSGWQPGESVALTLVEQPLLDTHPLVNVTADGDGNILSTEFVPDAHDVGIRFMLTAYGTASQAQTTFTDANPNASIQVTASPAGALGGTFQISRIQSNGSPQINGGTTPQTFGGNQPSSSFSITNIQSPVNGCTYTGSSTVNGTTGLADTTTTVTLTYQCAAPTATLKVLKHVVNDNGGTATASAWTMTVTATTPSVASFPGTESPGTTITIGAGSFSVAESGGPASGYTQTSAVGCSGTAVAGNTYTCTITNNDIAPKLHLRKLVTNDNGGTATVADFTLTANGTGANDLSGTSPVDSGAGLTADTWALSETGLTSYSASAWVCVGGTQNGSNITVGIGGEATCTITNDDIAPKLHLRKVVVNDNGGTKTVADFTLTADGTGTNDLSGTSPVDSGVGLKADTWALSETTVAGYTASAWSCVGGTQNGSNITVGIGGEATCTITNDDIQPKLTVTKVVVNDNGGTAVVGDFPLKVGTTTVVSGAQNGFNAATYAITETGPTAGYAATYSGDCVGGSITLAVGDVKTCTITNNDIAPKLHLRKLVTNDNGGSATVANFTLTADGTGTNDLSGTSPVDSGAGLVADTWALSETGAAGYSASAWSCVGGTQNGSSITVGIGGEATCTITNDDIQPKLTVTKVVVNDNGGTAVVGDFPLKVGTTTVVSGAQNGFNAATYAITETGPTAGYAVTYSSDCVGGSITLAVGDVKTCTITNDDIAPKLHLRKLVTNDNGGSATVANFTLTADGTGTNDLSGTSPVDSGAGLVADTWALSETGAAGYSASAWSCVGGTQNGSSITVGIGGEATCTITNDDIQPKLTVTKVVVNDNGGTAVVGDFPLKVGTTTVVSGAQNGFNAATYAITETGPTAGYAATYSGDCVGGSITLAVGDVKSCTITNNDIPPKLHLRKLVVNDNGGGATVANFTLTADGTGANDLSGTSPVDSGATLQAGTWALSETAVTGYAASAWVCVGGTQSGANITVDIGGEATCTITNDDIQPKLTVTKIVVNDNGGTAVVGDFPLKVGTTTVVSGAQNGFNAATYAITETGPTAGYAATYSGDCVGGSITLAVGDVKSCTITNNDIPPKLHLRKLVVNDNGGGATVANFTLTADGTGANDLSGTSPVDSGATLQADTWALSETNLNGYKGSSWICVGGTQSGSNITVGIGGEATCTITNDDLYVFQGFFAPIDNGGTVDFVNVANGGQAIPVKWRLTTLQGVPVSDPSSFGNVGTISPYPGPAPTPGLMSYLVPCDSFDVPADVEEYVGISTSGLSYKGDGNWQFNWKTPKNWANTCRLMVLTLSDGTTHTANFRFK